MIPRKHYLLLFVLVSILSFYYLDLWHNGNTVSRLLPLKTLAENGTWKIDAYHTETIDKAFINGHYYSEKAPLPALITTPVYILLSKSGLLRFISSDKLLYLTGSIVIAVIPFICIIMILFHSLVIKGWNIYKAMLTTLLLSFSSFVFIYAGTAFSHVMAGLWLILSYIYIRDKKKYAAAGFFAGLCFLTEYPTGLILFLWPALLFFKTRKPSSVILFYAGASPSILSQLIYNYIFTGNAFDMLYNHVATDFNNSTDTLLGFTLPIPEAMWKLLFGFYRGWFIHAPLILLFIALLIKQTIRTPRIMLTEYLVPLLITSYLIFSAHKVWYGGWCFGPRHLVALTFLMIYHFAKYLDWKGMRLYIFYLLSFAGVLYTWMAKCTLLYSINAEYANPLTQLILPAFRDGAFNENNLLTMVFGFPAKGAAIIWLSLFMLSVLLLGFKIKSEEKTIGRA